MLKGKWSTAGLRHGSDMLGGKGRESGFLPSHMLVMMEECCRMGV